MKFHEWVGLIQPSSEAHREIVKKHGIDACYGYAIKTAEKGTSAYFQAGVEQRWFRAVRPYYKVWPAIASALIKIPLTAPGSSMSLPCSPIVIRISEGSAATSVKAVLVDIIEYNDGEWIGWRRLSIFISVGTTWESICMAMKPGENMEQSLERAMKDSGRTDALPKYIYDAMRLTVAVCLLANDPSIVTPDVLEADKEKLATASEHEVQVLHEKARRRGKIGWSIGEAVEAMPHYRRPHFGIRHTGVGRGVPKIVPIKGAVVHRQKMSTVPTGFTLPDGREVEPGQGESGDNRAQVSAEHHVRTALAVADIRKAARKLRAKQT